MKCKQVTALLFGCLLTLRAFTVTGEPSEFSTLKMSADLDMDGDAESISMVFDDRSGRYPSTKWLLQVGSTLIDVRNFEVQPQISLVDIDSVDASLEIRVEVPRELSTSRIIYFFDGSKLQVVLKTHWDLRIDGSGIVRAELPPGPGPGHEIFLLLTPRHYLRELEKEMYRFTNSEWFELDRTLTIFRDPHGREELRTLKPGTRVRPVAGSDKYPSSLVELEGGVRGWCMVEIAPN